MRVFPIVVLAVAGLVLTSSHAQQLYKWVDKDGKITYSDQPPPKDAKNVEQKKSLDSGPGVDDIPYSVKVAIERNPVTLYANFCGSGCDKARALLSTRGVPFTDKNPDKDPGALDALKAATGALDVPVLIVGARILRGFAESEWQEALTAAGYPRTNPNLRSQPPAPAAAQDASKAAATPR
ncbi:MAG: glutaredoxin family protein [Betaproteobacteria bacterium]|nr:glutaredoxin family protein [Betaproteobacteria bacterium]